MEKFRIIRIFGKLYLSPVLRNKDESLVRRPRRRLHHRRTRIHQQQPFYDKNIKEQDNFTNEKIHNCKMVKLSEVFAVKCCWWNSNLVGQSIAAEGDPFCGGKFNKTFVKKCSKKSNVSFYRYTQLSLCVKFQSVWIYYKCSMFCPTKTNSCRKYIWIPNLDH